MQIAKDAVVRIHYTLKNDAGEVLDSSAGREPLAYLQGHGNLIPGLEAALEGRRAGDAHDVSIAPAQGYGVRDEALVEQVPRSAFRGVDELRPGMQFRTARGVVTVSDVQGETVTVDGNHPLADQTLHFAVQVVEVRAASTEELHHGHVHGPGGHAH